MNEAGYYVKIKPMAVTYERPRKARPFSPDEVLLFDAMKKQMGVTGYDRRFRARQLVPEEDPHGFLRVDKAHIPAAAFSRETLQGLCDILDTVVSKEDRLRLFEAIRTKIFEAHAEYLGRGGNIIIPTSHTSYLDGVLMTVGQAMADPRIENHHIIMGQQAALFEMEGIGCIADKVLHPTAGVIKTIPANHAKEISGETGEKVDILPDGLRDMVNNRFLSSYQAVLEAGGQTIVIAPSAEEDVYVPGRGMVMRRADKATTRLLTYPNFEVITSPTKERPERKVRLPKTDEELRHRKGSALIVPVYIGCFPWNEKGELVGSARINFAFGDPHFARKEGDVHRAMMQIAELGSELPDSPYLTVYSETANSLGGAALKV